MNNLELLHHTMLFKGCTEDELELALGLFQERQIKSSTTIFTENMPAEALYIIKSEASGSPLWLEKGTSGDCCFLLRRVLWRAGAHPGRRAALYGEVRRTDGTAYAHQEGFSGTARS